MIYILLAWPLVTGHPPETVIHHEFNSEASCQAALTALKDSPRSWWIGVCVPKGESIIPWK